jgi:hypothetical protein
MSRGRRRPRPARHESYFTYLPVTSVQTDV